MAMMDEDKMRRAFNLFDKDGDGKISQDELDSVLKTIGRPATPQELRAMIGGSVEGMFTERGGAIDFGTFKNILMGDVRGGRDESLGNEITDLQEAFKLLDKEGKGYIGAAELCAVCKKLGEDLSPEEAESMVGEALIGYTGQIYYDGLLKILITQ